MQVIQLKCPSCSAAVSSSDKTCEYCGSPVLVSSFRSMASLTLPQISKYKNAYSQTLTEHPDNIDVNTSLGLCYLKLKMYDPALRAFEKAMPENFENPEPFFYAAVSLLQGKKAFLTPRPNIDKALEYLNAAAMIDMKPMYYYFMAYIKQDYFERKFLNCSPSWSECLSSAVDLGLGEGDRIELFEILGVTRPDSL